MKQLIPCLCEMKSIACAAVLCVLPAAAFSQQMIPVMPSMFNTDISKYEVLDTAEYEVSYSLKCVEDPSLKVMKTPVPDVCVLQIGKHISKTYSETVYANDSLDAAQLKAGAGVLSSLKAPVPPVEVFKGYPSGRMTTTYLPIIGGALPAFRYAEPVPQQDWKIGAATKKILGYDCTEATCSYRGRDYVAWFTTAIPLKDGPWMFGGLPGLILAIHDTQNQYVFRCIGISQKPEPIKMFKRQYKDGSRAQVRKAIHSMFENPSTFSGVPFRMAGSGKRFVASMPYNPIELE